MDKARVEEETRQQPPHLAALSHVRRYQPSEVQDHARLIYQRDVPRDVLLGNAQKDDAEVHDNVSGNEAESYR